MGKWITVFVLCILLVTSIGCAQVVDVLKSQPVVNGVQLASETGIMYAKADIVPQLQAQANSKVDSMNLSPEVKAQVKLFLQAAIAEMVTEMDKVPAFVTEEYVKWVNSLVVPPTVTTTP